MNAPTPWSTGTEAMTLLGRIERLTRAGLFVTITIGPPEYLAPWAVSICKPPTDFGAGHACRNLAECVDAAETEARARGWTK
jgi:hypothetical protein